MAEEVVQVVRAGPRAWVWRYRGPGGKVMLANRTFLTHEEAVHSATRAFPGARVEDPLRNRVRVPAGKLAVIGAAAVAAAVLAERWRVHRSIRVRPVSKGQLLPAREPGSLRAPGAGRLAGRLRPGSTGPRTGRRRPVARG